MSEPDPKPEATALEVRDGARITGGERVSKHLDAADLALVFEIYETWKAAGVGEVTCSQRTFEAHLDFEQLYAGPWKWNIASGIPYGDVRMYSYTGAYLGVVSVSNLKLNLH